MWVLGLEAKHTYNILEEGGLSSGVQREYTCANRAKQQRNAVLRLGMWGMIGC